MTTQSQIFLLILFFLIPGCQTAKKYHDSLIEDSLVTEVPTLIGNLAGGIAGVPFLLFTLPAGYFFYPDVEENLEKSREDRTSFTLAPMNATSHALGIVMGTPFYPFGLIFPREKPQEKQ